MPAGREKVCHHHAVGICNPCRTDPALVAQTGSPPCRGLAIRRAGQTRARWNISRPAESHSAIQQITNLRYRPSAFSAPKETKPGSTRQNPGFNVAANESGKRQSFRPTILLAIMDSPTQFIEAFLRAQAEVSAASRELHRSLEARFFEPEYQALYSARRAAKNNSPERILSVEDAGSLTKVITSGPPSGIPKRYRYHLRRSETTWQIFEREWECMLCAGSGRQADSACDICHGTGWKDSVKHDG